MNPAFETLFQDNVFCSPIRDGRKKVIWDLCTCQTPAHLSTALCGPRFKNLSLLQRRQCGRASIDPCPLQRSLYGELWGRRLAEHWWMLIRASQPVVKTTCQSYHGAPFISVSTFWLHNPFHKPLWVIKGSLAALECQRPHEEGVQTNELENIS